MFTIEYKPTLGTLSPAEWKIIICNPVTHYGIFY